MQKLTCTWRQQKASSSAVLTKKLSDGDNHLKAAPVRRRLGRFAIAVTTTQEKVPLEPTASGCNLKDKSGLFQSSFSVNHDLMEEMDKVEAAMAGNPANCQDPSKDKNTVSKSCISGKVPKSSTYYNEPGVHSGKTVQGSNVFMTRGLVKRHRMQNPPVKKREDAAKGVEMLKRVDSPSSSPLDKKLRLHGKVTSTLALKKDYNVNGKVNKVSETSTSLLFHGGAKQDLDLEACTDISFSPLIATPDISPTTSDDETSAVNIKSSRKTTPSQHSKQNSSRLRRHQEPDISYTPKRPRSRKRLSPKYAKSPVVKIAKAKRFEGATPVQEMMRFCDKSETCNEEGHQDRSSGNSQGIKKRENLSGCSPRGLPKPEANASKQAEDCCMNDQKSVHLGNTKVTKPRSRPGQTSRTNLTTATKQCGLNDTNHSEVEKSALINPLSCADESNTSRQLSVTLGEVSLTEDKRMLSSWGLPQPVLEAYHGQGVSTMFEWQAACLLSPGVLEGGNLVYSAPTSAGKTLVAELLVLKRVVETRKKALIILPFVSVAREKMFSLKKLYQDAGIRVGGYMGSYSPAGGWSALDVAVCTIEKGNSLVNRMMEDGKMEDIGIVVVDELHMIGDSHRGYLLELMLTKLSFMANRNKSQQNLQIIGMSATLPNLEVLSKWLNAALFRTDYRPVPLSEHIKVDTKILDCQLNVTGMIPASLILPDDSDHVIALCLETVRGGHSVLVFCPTKNWCEKLCEMIARKFYELTHPPTVAMKGKEEHCYAPFTLNKDGLRESIEQLRRCPVGVDPMLGRCLVNGVAYHHAGLTFDERDIVEGAFRQGSLRVLVATSTLSSGVNLPARRVIIRTPMFHGKVLDTLTYKQMSGRAGRKGVDTEGESILMCKASEKMKGKDLLQSDLPVVESCLDFDEDSGLSRSLKRAILEVVVSGAASCPDDVTSYIHCTLLSASLDSASEKGQMALLLEHCTKFLQENEFVAMQTVTNEDGSESRKFSPTQLGSAILASSMSPDEGILVFSELQKARRSFVLETDLHIIYLVTPIYSSDIGASIDWYHYYTLWERLTPADRRVAELVGVREAFIARAISGRVSTKTDAQRKSLAIHQRFYTALVLNTLVQEVPLTEVAAKFGLNKGQLQSLQQSAATYAGMVTVFSGRLGWHSMELLLSNFQRRLALGVQHQLVDLVRISTLNAASARMLYNGGYTTVADVAHAYPVDVENLFRKAAPFQSEKKQDGESEWERQERCKARCIWLTGRKGMTESDAATAIIEEAKLIVQGDMGVRAVVWSPKEAASDDDGNDNGSSEEDDDDKENRDLNRRSKDVGETSKIDGKRRRSMGTIENTCVTNHKTPYGRRSSRFTHLKTKTMKDGTPQLTLSSRKNKGLSGRESVCRSGTPQLTLSSRKNKGLSGRESVCRSVIGSKKPNSSPGDPASPSLTSLTEGPGDPASPSPTSLTEGPGDPASPSPTSLTEGPVNTRSNQKSGRSRRRRSDKNLLKEQSFFGQVVVSPPPGVSPRSLCGRSVPGHGDHSMPNNESRDGDNVPNNKSRDADNGPNKCHSPSKYQAGPAKWTSSKLREDTWSETHTDTSGCHDLGKTSQPGGKQGRYDLRGDGYDMDKMEQGKDTLSANEFKESKDKEDGCIVSLVKSTIPPKGAVPTEVLRAENGKHQCSSASPNAMAGGLSSDFPHEGTGKQDETHGTKVGTVDHAAVSMCDGAENAFEKSDGNNMDCSFGGSFVLDTQTVNLINHGVQLTSNACKPCPSDQSKLKDSVNRLESFDDTTDGRNGLEKCGNHPTCPGGGLGEECATKGQSCLGLVRYSTSDLQGELLTNCHKGTESCNSSIHSPAIPVADVGALMGEGEDAGQFSSLVAASDYDNAVNFDEGMLECSFLEEGEDLTNVSPDRPKKGLSESNEITGSALSSCETISRASDTQLTDDSLLVAVRMPSSYPLSPVVLMEGNCARTHDHSHSSPLLGETAQEKKDFNINNQPSTQQSYSGSHTSQNQDLMEDDLFTDSFTVSLADRALAQCIPSSLKFTSLRDFPRHQHCQTKLKTSSAAHGNDEPRPLHPMYDSNSSILQDIIESPNSNGSSPNDSKDCVLATPPEEKFTSLRSPGLRTSLLTPLKRNGKMAGTILDKTKSFKKMPSSGNCQVKLATRLDRESSLQSKGKSPSGKGKSLVEEGKFGRKSRQPEKPQVNALGHGEIGSVTGDRNTGHKNTGDRNTGHKNTGDRNTGHKNTGDRNTGDRDTVDRDTGDRDTVDRDTVDRDTGDRDTGNRDTVDRDTGDRDTGDRNTVDRDTDERDTVDSRALPQSPNLQAVRASQPLSQQPFTIIDVCADKELFDTFCQEWRGQSTFALALACEKLPPATKERPAVSIGGKFMKKRSPLKCGDAPLGLVVPDTSLMIVGIAVSWENRDAYFISLLDSFCGEEDPDDSLSEPPLCEDLPLGDRLAAVCQVLAPDPGKSSLKINVYDAKTAYNFMAKTLGVAMATCQDPRVADWLKEPGTRLKNLHRMVITLLPEEIPLLEAVGGVTGYQALGTDFKNKTSGRIRACTESVLTMKLMGEYEKHLEQELLWDAFVKTEMPSLVTLARMEMNGFGVDQLQLDTQKELMTSKLETLEQEAYKMAGHPFSLTSTDDIARVLYLDLKLPINGDPDQVRKLPSRSSRRKGSMLGGTGKEILEKLEKFHPLPTLILEWRRISSALTKSLFALKKAAKWCDRLQMMRVFGECQIFSATGRVSMAEPNIQNIPKDFAIQLSDQRHRTDQASGQLLAQPVSMRRLFVPLQGGVILAADYSQLELRIIAHLSEDKRLGQILNSRHGDVFKLIASQMKMIDVEEVTPSDRQQAKQVCYGMLYGIGAKALGEQLGMCEDEASVFMETFKSKYPGVRRYLRETVEFCQKNGFVRTLFNRRRYLPAIKHSNPHARAHAERQAVNTSIQGSAADLVKRAMASIDWKLTELFPDSLTAHCQAGLKHGFAGSRPANSGSPPPLPTGAFFVLQLHDELIYEVSAEHVDTVARLVKYEMEKAVHLHVQLPVKVKVGLSWGQLEDYLCGS